MWHRLHHIQILGRAFAKGHRRARGSVDVTEFFSNQVSTGNMPANDFLLSNVWSALLIASKLLRTAPFR
jgi:hypothetical protein